MEIINLPDIYSLKGFQILTQLSKLIKDYMEPDSYFKMEITKQP